MVAKKRNRVRVFSFNLLWHLFEGKGCGWAQQQKGSASIYAQAVKEFSPAGWSNPLLSSHIKNAWCTVRLATRERRTQFISLRPLVVHGRARPVWEYGDVSVTVLQVDRKTWKMHRGQSPRFRFGNFKSNWGLLPFFVSTHCWFC